MYGYKAKKKASRGVMVKETDLFLEMAKEVA